MSDEQVSVRVHFERFPATVKGAFVIRGEDRDPHQVVLRHARVAAVSGGGERQLSMDESTLDVAPRRDVFVPFELSVADLAPGWYGLECDLDVDGQPRRFPGARRFLVPWPRSAVRRGQVRVGKKLRAEDLAVTVERVECAADSIRIPVVVKPPEPIKIRLTADGARLDLLDIEFDEEAGKGAVTAYPLLRTHESLRVEVAPARVRGWDPAASVHVALP